MPNFDDLLNGIDDFGVLDNSLNVEIGDIDIPAFETKELDIKNDIPEINIINKQPNKINKKDKDVIKISQTLIKDLFYKGEPIVHCPYYIYRHRILNDVDNIKSSSMTRGLYVEQQMIGSSAHGDNNTIMDRNRRSCKDKYRPNCNGCSLYNECKKTASHEKADYQIELYKRLIKEYDMNIHPGINTQVKIMKTFKNEPDFMIEGTMDIFPVIMFYDDDYSICHVDMKTTGKLDNQFGYFSWGDIDKVDPIQLNVYQYLTHNIDFNLNSHLPNAFKLLYQFAYSAISSYNVKSRYWVFEMDPSIFDLKNKVFEKPWSKMIYDETHEVIRNTIDLIKEYNAEDRWQERKCCYQCGKCFFKETCEYKCEN